MEFIQGAGGSMAAGDPDEGLRGFPGAMPPGFGAPPGFGQPGMTGQPGMMGAGQASFASYLAEDIQQKIGATPLVPCLTYIGVDEGSKLLKKAITEEYDALILFELEIGFNRILNKVTNDTRVRVVIPKEVAKDTKAIYSSKKLNNLQAAKSKAAGDSDGVQEVIEALIKKLEEGLALKEMPSALTADIVTKRLVPAIVEDDNGSVLSRLSEVNYYYAKGYIDENSKSDAFEKIASKNGLALATGTKKEKTEAIEKLLDDELK